MPNQNKHIENLNNIEKKNNFIVPEGYFENFPSRLNGRIVREKEDFSTSQGLRSFSPNKLSLAASFIGLTLLIFSGMKFLLRDKEPAGIISPVVAEITDYQINEIDDEMLFELYTETLSENQSQHVQDETEILNAMIEYLLYTDMDIGLIAQELQ